MNANSFADLETFATVHRGWLFRGMRDPNWPLETSLERASKRCGKSSVEYEQRVVREFRRHAHTFLHRIPNEMNELEWLALMQHYGAPTRLLDFTRSFWIALFFAYETAETECAVWALDPTSLGDKTGRDFNDVLRENIANGRHRESTLFEDVPYYTNERLAIQQGTFVFSLDVAQRFHDLFIKNQKVYDQLTVNQTLFPEIRARLNEFNCNSRVLFPGIDGYAKHFQNYDF
jgi:hypothetical protein